MRNKLIILFAFVLVFSVFPQAVSADLIMPGTKSISWCYKISNIDNYPDYVFFLHGYPLAEGVPLKQGECINFYKFASPHIYAIKNNDLMGMDLELKLAEIRSKIEQEELNGAMEIKGQELISKIKAGTILLTLEEIKEVYLISTSLEEFYQKDYLIREYALLKIRDDEFMNFFGGNLVKSNLQISAFGLVQENDPLQKAVIILNIASLTENNLNIQKSKVTYTYTDGTSEEKVFQSQEIMPKPSKTAILPWWFAKFWYVILPIVAIILIGIILLLRRLKK